MTEKPILFSAPMIRAILSGSKTVTRRILKPMRGATIADLVDTGRRQGIAEVMELPLEKLAVPPLAIGQRLWVREAWRTPKRWDKFSPSTLVSRCLEAGHKAAWCPTAFDADGSRVNWDRALDGEPGRLRASMHLPRPFARITLEVTGVKVERLQDISEEEAKAEGVYFKEPTADDHEWAKAYALETGEPIDVEGVWIAPGTRQGFGTRPNDPKWGPTAATAFRFLWDSINGEREGASWEANPYVAAISFKVVKP